MDTGTVGENAIQSAKTHLEKLEFLFDIYSKQLVKVVEEQENNKQTKIESNIVEEITESTENNSNNNKIQSESEEEEEDDDDEEPIKLPDDEEKNNLIILQKKIMANLFILREENRKIYQNINFLKEKSISDRDLIDQAELELYNFYYEKSHLQSEIKKSLTVKADLSDLDNQNIIFSTKSSENSENIDNNDNNNNDYFNKIYSEIITERKNRKTLYDQIQTAKSSLKTITARNDSMSRKLRNADDIVKDVEKGFSRAYKRVHDLLDD